MHCSESQPDADLYGTGLDAENCPRSMRSKNQHRQAASKKLMPRWPDESIRGPKLDYDQWRELLRSYTKCQLTKPPDKLVAISAIAKATKSSFEAIGESSRYLAGIWEAKLPAALAWRVHPDSVCERRPAVYRAPSWSWAAVDGEIKDPWQFRADESFAQVISAETTPLTDDETGQVTNGVITLQGAVLLATVGDVYSRPGLQTWTKATTCRHVTFSSFLEPRLQGIPGSMIECIARAWIHFDTDDDICAEIQFIPIFFELCVSILGLALVPVEGAFRRVGMIEIEIPTHKEAVLACISQLPRQTVVIK